MAAVTLLGSATFDTNSGTKTVTATPAVNDLIVIVTAHSGNTSAATPTDDQSGTYTEITSAVKNTSADTMRVFIRTALIASAVSTVFTHAPGTSTGGGLGVFKVTGMSKTGATAARQSAKQDNQAGSTTPAPVFGSACLTGNAVIGAIFHSSGTAIMAPPASYTELFESVHGIPSAGLEGVSRDSGETGTTITWGSASSAFCSLVVELDTSASGTTYNESVSEAATAGESLANAVTWGPTLTEAATPADSLGTTGIFGVVLAESVTPADALVGGLLLSSTLSEAVTPADALAGGLLFSETVSEPVTPADSLSAAATFANAISAAVTLADSYVSALTLAPVWELGIKAIRWMLDRPASITAGWTATRTIIADPWRAKWRAGVELATVQGEANVRKFKSFIAQRKGQIVPFRLYATAGAQNENTGVTTTGTTAQGATSMTITGAATTLKDGQLVTVNGQLLCCTADQSGSTITFQPPLRAAASAGTKVVTSRPYALVHMAASSAGWSASPGRLFNAAFDVEEAVLESDGVAPE